MVEFGDELIIESYRIPWLIWIQLFVMILLVLLLFFGFTVFTSDSSTSSSAGAAASPPTAPPTHLNNPTSSDRIIKVEDRSARSEAGPSEGSIREDDPGGDESSFKDSIFLRIFRRPHHPCNYIGLAKQALFKCFGLDSSSESSSSNRQYEKQE
ncbi:uncharacterized protein LOC105171255 [Sesamum indicum]|uniref:Uncharacterized protein LOC105171255 n=1 Tax=Sesamum indicum TaxID=4182 RepID=A0A6I9U9I7_SESIN|nr:uncharacterized protein LOC105171255 [Sesamum indicum]